MSWTAIGLSTEIPVASGREYVVGDKIVAVFHTEAGFFAIDGICMHAGGPLAQGRVSGCVVTCPWHGWQYDVTSGRHCLNERLVQRSYPVQLDGETILVDTDPQDANPNDTDAS